MAVEILKFPSFRAVAITVDAAKVTAVDGKKILPAGTIIGGVSAKFIDDPTQKVENKNDELKATGAEGVLLYDVDVTEGDSEGVMVFEGDIDETQLPEAPVAEVELQFVRFWK